MLKANTFDFQYSKLLFSHSNIEWLVNDELKKIDKSVNNFDMRMIVFKFEKINGLGLCVSLDKILLDNKVKKCVKFSYPYFRLFLSNVGNRSAYKSTSCVLSLGLLKQGVKYGRYNITNMTCIRESDNRCEKILLLKETE